MIDKSIMGSAASNSPTGIENIAELIKNTVNMARKPATSLPPFYTTIEGMMRPGLSAISLTSNIITRLGEI